MPPYYFSCYAITLIYYILSCCTHCCATFIARKSVEIGHSKHNFADMSKLIKLDMQGPFIPQLLPTPGEAKAKAMPGRLYTHT